MTAAEKNGGGKLLARIVKRPMLALSSRQFLLIVAALYTALFNPPFLLHGYAAAFETPNTSITFLVALPLLLFGILYLAFSATLWSRLAKPLIGIVSIASLPVLYGELTYGVVFDNDMMRNIFETDLSEALGYLSVSSIGFLLAGSAATITALMSIEIRHQPIKQELIGRAASTSLVLFLGLILTYGCYGEFAATARNNNHLKRELVPFEWIDSAADYWADRWIDSQQALVVIDPAPKQSGHPGSLPHITVVIVGETARADHFQYSGYPRATNQFTEKFEPIYIANMSSCGTATAISVPCMFSDLNRNKFAIDTAKYRQNALDLSALAGTEVVWIDNNSSCKGVCTRVEHRRIDINRSTPECDGSYCLDEVLIEELRAEIQSQSGEEKIVVLHEIGSHGPTYYRRYQRTDALFTPECLRSDIQNCSNEALVNTYDNTIAHSDRLHADIMALLAEKKDALSSTVIYVSDHGESLGEGGLYLHGMPYMVAPESQTKVPMWVWESRDERTWRDCVERNRDQMQPSHDIVFHSLLGAAHIETTAMNHELNLFQGCEMPDSISSI